MKLRNLELGTYKEILLLKFTTEKAISIALGKGVDFLEKKNMYIHQY